MEGIAVWVGTKFKGPYEIDPKEIALVMEKELGEAYALVPFKKLDRGPDKAPDKACKCGSN